MVNLDGDPIWSPIKENDLKYAVNTNWDLFQHEPIEDVLPAQRHLVAEDDRRGEGSVAAGWDAARELRQAAGGGELEGRQGESAGKTDRRVGDAEGVREHQAGRTDSAHR